MKTTKKTIDFLKIKLGKDTRLSLNWSLGDAQIAYKEISNNPSLNRGDWYDWMLCFLRAEIRRLGGEVEGFGLRTPEEMGLFKQEETITKMG